MIKYPGHEAAMWTLILAVGGIATALILLASGNRLQASILAPIPLACMGIWFGFEPAKYVILVFQALLVLRAGMKLVDEFQLFTLMKCIAYVYVLWFFARWKAPATIEE